jgi:UDP-N-acetyl-D-glucosamine dehydrogenase
MELLAKIEGRTARIGIIGLGYVGLPLVFEFCRAGFQVTGFDIDPVKVEKLSRNESYIKHLPSSLIAEAAPRFIASNDFGQLASMDCIIICVPTPLNKYREPDLSYVMNTTKAIADNLRKGQLIILESTTYPGTTDQDMRAILEQAGYRAGEDFYLAYSPEREDPNNPEFSTRTIPKVVGGFTPRCLAVAKALYDTVVDRTVPVSSTRAAESTKLVENIYRAVNIALMNELKMCFDRMGIDIWEVIGAAKTKPFGFHAFYPGPGLGGHCIPIDPFYLTWKAREYEFPTKFIELAGEINTSMPYYVVEQTIKALNGVGKSVKGARILILGLAYKKDIDDIRESPALKIIDLLQDRQALVDYNDPYIPRTHKMRKYDLGMESIQLTPDNVKTYDCVVIVTDHSSYDPNFILEHAQLVVDTRNVIKRTMDKEGKVIRA